MTDHHGADAIDATRSIEVEIEVPGTPEDVWTAIATGPGISSWYVPHEIDEREGGAAVARFGSGPEMQVDGVVAAWEPPRRVVFTGGGPDAALAFEWTIEAQDGGTCVVRLVNSGFSTDEEWDDHYDAMTEGWRLFLTNLHLHLTHFAGRSAAAGLPMAMWPGPRDGAWGALLSALGVDPSITVGSPLTIDGVDGPQLSGTVADVGAHHVVLLVDTPAPGTAFLAAEGAGDQIMVSIWSYLYGDGGTAAAVRDEKRWQAWLIDHTPAGPDTPRPDAP